MTVTLARILKYGWQSFLRNKWLAVSTVSIMFLAGLVFEGLILFNVVSKTAINSLQEKIDISVYFKSNAAEDAILSIKRSLEGLDEVKKVDYVSKELALREFKDRHAGEDTITQTLEELGENPLLASLNIKAKDPRQYEAIANYLESSSLKDIIEKVTYAQNEVVIKRLNSLIATLKRSGLGLTLFLAFLAVAVTFNTIRLAIFSASDQLNIMRLVGASNAFIRGPYIVESMIYGAIAGFLSFLVMIPIVHFVSPYILNFIPEMNLAGYLVDNLGRLLFYQLLFGVGLGSFSSFFAVRRYLKI
jgi:cell division transport system permease protein